MPEHRVVQNLRNLGYRLTPQRLMLLQLFEESHGHLSATEIYQRASQRLPGVTEPTIYRNLDFLVSQGLVRLAQSGSGRRVYESAVQEHHHLVCRLCGSSKEIPHGALDTLYMDFERTTGFRIDSSHVTFFGVCPQCRPQEVPPA